MEEKRNKIVLKSLVATEFALVSEVFINDEEERFCYALERLWEGNKRRVSCIPSGQYKTKPYSSRRYPKVCEIQNVENRDKILIHAANYPHQLMGCIALGETFIEHGVFSDKETTAVFHSNKALRAFYEKVGYSFDLILDSKYRDESRCKLDDNDLLG